MSMESDMRKAIEKGVEDGVEDGIVNAVEELIEKGYIKLITQDIINVIACNIVSLLKSPIFIDIILAIVLTSQIKLPTSILLKVLESKLGTIKDEELKTKMNKIKDSEEINLILKQLLQLDSVESIEGYIKKFKSCNNTNKTNKTNNTN